MENLAFFDAIAPIIHAESIDLSKAWFQSRYDKGETELEKKAYLNCPMSKEEYQKDLQLWYSKDKGKSIMDELLSLMHHWDAKKVAVPCPETH